MNFYRQCAGNIFFNTKMLQRLTQILILVTIPTMGLARSTTSFSEELWQTGLRYQSGNRVKQNFKIAYMYYCRSAKSGYASAFTSIGWMLMVGLGVKRDLAAALGWYEQAAKMGDIHAAKLLKKYNTVTPNYSARCSFKRSKITRGQVKQWVTGIANRYRVDPELVFALINQESAFDPNALSPKNARGLMQLIPATAKRFGVRNIWDPQQNLKGGIAYINWLLRYFKGDVKLALAGYNAGEGAVNKYKGIPPYKETQNYVRRIMKKYKKSRHPIPPKVSS